MLRLRDQVKGMLHEALERGLAETAAMTDPVERLIEIRRRFYPDAQNYGDRYAYWLQITQEGVGT